MAPHNRILVGLVSGATLGVAANLATGGPAAVDVLVRTLTEPLGRMWLAALIMVVIPLIVSTLSLGVAGLGSGRLGRIGLVTLMSFLSLTALSATLGLVVMNSVRPGEQMDAAVRTRLLETYRGQAEGAMGLSGSGFGLGLIEKVVPRNPFKAAADGDMLAVIFVSLMIGVALTKLSAERAEPMRRWLDSLGEVTIAIIEIVMRAAPVGVFCLVFSVTARFGHDLLLQLLVYVVTVVCALAAFQLVVYPLVLVLVARRSPREFFSRSRVVFLTAFSTSSSSATLPTTIRVARHDLGIPPEIAGFVLPLGATLNMNGTALFEGATVLFLAQVFGVELTLGSQVVVVLMAVVTAIGTAGVPGASIPLLMMVLGMVGVPMEGIAVILGVDRILDMCRTVLNVTGDLVTAAVVARFGRGRSTAPASIQDLGSPPKEASDERGV